MLILLEEIYLVVRSHLRFAIGSFLLVLIFVALVIVFSPRKYQSRAKLMVRVGRESVVRDPTASNAGNIIQLHRTSEHEINTAVAGMGSRAILEKVVEKIGVEPILSGHLLKEEKSNKSWVSRAFSTFAGSLTGTLRNIDPVSDHERAVIEQADLLVRNLAIARAKLQGKKDASGLATVAGKQQLLEQRLKVAADQVVETESQLFEIKRRSDVLANVVDKLDINMVTSRTSGLSDDVYEGIVQEIFKLEADQTGLATKMKDVPPRRKFADEQVEQLQQSLTSLSSERETTILRTNPTRSLLQQQMLMDQASAAGLEKKREQAQQHFVVLAKSILSLNREDNEIAALIRDVDFLEAQYRAQAERVEQSRFERALRDQRLSGISILQPATLEEKLISPKKMLCILLGGMSAVCTAIEIPFFLYDRARIRCQKSVSMSKPIEDGSHWNSSRIDKTFQDVTAHGG